MFLAQHIDHLLKLNSLLDAIAKQDLASVEALLAAGAPANGSTWRRFTSELTPLLAAIRVGAKAIVAVLLDYGADPNFETRRLVAPLAFACQVGRADIVELLIDRGARINQGGRTRHPSPLQMARMYHRDEIAQILLNRDDDDPAAIRGVGLIEAIDRNDFARVDALLKAGTSPNGKSQRRVKNADEPTPLIAAVRAGAVEIASLLLVHGADPNIETRKLMSPLTYACQRGNLTIAELLIAHGARVNPTGKSPHPTPIETASWNRHEAVVAFLLERGANPDSVFSNGIESLSRIPPSILRRLVDAGGHPPPGVERLIADEFDQ